MAKETDGAESVELVPVSNAQALAEVLSGMREATAPSLEETQETRFKIIAEMLAAETEADLWKEATTWSSKDMVDRAFEIQDAHAWRSKFTGQNGETGGFLSCPAIDLETGEQGILNTGAMRVAARIGWYKLHGRLPIRLRIVKRGETGNGYTILDAELV